MGQFESLERPRLAPDMQAMIAGEGEIKVIRKKRKEGKKLTDKDSSMLASKFAGCVNNEYWEYAESLIVLGDENFLNFALKFTLDYLWFLRTQEDHDALIGLVEKIITSGATDFATAAYSTLFLGSCVLAFKIRRPKPLHILRNFEHEVIQIVDRLKIFMCKSGFKPLDGEGDAELFQEFTKCIDFSSSRDNSSDLTTQLHFSAFKKFLDVAGNKLTPHNMAWALQMACLGLSFYSYFFDRGCSSPIWGTSAIPDFLNILVERDLDDVTQCLVQVSCSKSTVLVRIFLKVARMNNLTVNFDMAVKHNLMFSNVEILKILLEDAAAAAAINTVQYLVEAAGTGNKQVVEVFVNKGCQDIHLYTALVASTCSSQVDVSGYLLPLVPPHLLAQRCPEILMLPGKQTGVHCLDGVAFLLRSDFLGDPEATYALADKIAMEEDDNDSSNDEIVRMAELRAFLKDHWSEEAFLDGRRQAEEYYVNFVRILKRGQSPLCSSCNSYLLI